jgi:hypothetical protein
MMFVMLTPMTNMLALKRVPISDDIRSGKVVLWKRELDGTVKG